MISDYFQKPQLQIKLITKKTIIILFKNYFILPVCFLKVYMCIFDSIKFINGIHVFKIYFSYEKTSILFNCYLV